MSGGGIEGGGPGDGGDGGGLGAEKSSGGIPSWLRCSTEQTPHVASVAGGAIYEMFTPSGMVKVGFDIGYDTITSSFNAVAVMVMVSM